jgi:hypothetical protein
MSIPDRAALRILAAVLPDDQLARLALTPARRRRPLIRQTESPRCAEMQPMPAGRPPRSTEKSSMVGVRMTDTEKARLTAVLRENENLSDFIRGAANLEAERREGVAGRRRKR